MKIFLAYLGLSITWSFCASLLIYVLISDGSGFPNAARTALWSLWGPDNLFAVRGGSFVYYLFAAVNAVIAVMLPLLTLGAFVFKLFRHDPLTWRSKLTIEASRTGSFTLAARFYNRFTEDIGDLNVRAWIRWTPGDGIGVYRNKPLDLLMRNQLSEFASWPLARSAEPTTVRIPICPTSCIPPLTEEEVLVQGDVIPRPSATIIFIVTGTVNGLNEEFKSIHTFALGGKDTIQSQWFQTISLDRRNRKEWANFDDTQLIYVFLHDTMMHSDNLASAGLQQNRIGPAAISGYRRFWSTVPAEASNGSVLASGLETSSGSKAHGLVVVADYLQLAQLDGSRLIGERSDVTSHIIWPPGGEPPQPFRVFSYVATSPYTRATTRYSQRKLAVAFHRQLTQLGEAAGQVGDDCRLDVAAFLEGSKHQIRRLTR